MNVSWPHGPFLCHCFIYRKECIRSKKKNRKECILHCISLSAIPVSYLAFFLVSACERLILLHHDPHELRDYAALLYHCGYYEDCLHYLSLYQTAKVILSGMTPYHGSEPENVKLTNITLHCFFAGWAIPDEPIGDLGGRSCEYSQGAGNPYFSRGWLEQQM